MSLSCTSQDRDNRANKIYVVTKHSQDGRSLEGFWMDYNPKDNYALFLLQFTLNASDGVDYYSVYDANGERDKNFLAEHWPKRS